MVLVISGSLNFDMHLALHLQLLLSLAVVGIYNRMKTTRVTSPESIMAALIECSVSVFLQSKTDGGLSPLYPKEVGLMKLHQCDRDIGRHIKNLLLLSGCQ